MIKSRRTGMKDAAILPELRRLRRVVLVIAVAVIVPVILLVIILFQKIRAEDSAIRERSVDEAVAQIQASLSAIVESEERRPFEDFGFFSLSTNRLIQRQSLKFSPLSELDRPGGVPGTLGYFQIDPRGAFSTPLLPESAVPDAGLGADELAVRRARAAELERIIEPGRWKSRNPAPDAQRRESISVLANQSFKNFEFVQNQQAAGINSYPTESVVTFTAQFDSMRMYHADESNLIFARAVRRGADRFIQGFVVDRRKFFAATIGETFRRTVLGSDGLLRVHLDGRLIDAFPEDRGTFSKASKSFVTRSLRGAFEGLSLEFATASLPTGGGRLAVNAIVVLLALTVPLGFYGVYVVGRRQIEIAKERSDFVAAMSHELKTPITSIRMYGEMLREGWVEDEARKREYYDSIYREAERLSRLVSNVLSFSQLAGREISLKLEPIAVDDLVQLADSMARPLAAAAGFEWVSVPLHDPSIVVGADADAYAQVVFNLVDNAIKFSRSAETKRIDFGARPSGEDIEIFVRDFGPGIPDGARSKIFELFYRAEDEMIRSTSGTGLGLALVRALVRAMNGSVRFESKEPGSEFSVTLRRVRATANSAASSNVS